MKKKRKAIISPFAALSLLLFFIIGIAYVAADCLSPVADMLNAGICQSFRRLMASFGDLFEFSLFEALIICLPLILFFVIYGAIRAFSRGEGLRYVISFASAVLLIYSGHILALGIGYMTTDISETMDLPETEVTAEGLTEAMTMLRDEVNSLADEVERNRDGVFDPGYTYPELSRKICDSYAEFTAKYDLPKSYYSNAKGVTFGNAMSYLGISGIYTYITGEANVNTAYPAYVTIFTAAHEMSHQRGILRENEANFTAYIVTSSSEDVSLRYSGALNMYEYFASALYKTDKEAYYSVAEGLCESARRDIRAAYAVNERYGDTVIEEISDRINDLYLKGSGSEGIISYSRVVELALSYFEIK